MTTRFSQLLCILLLQNMAQFAISSMNVAPFVSKQKKCGTICDLFLEFGSFDRVMYYLLPNSSCTGLKFWWPSFTPEMQPYWWPHQPISVRKLPASLWLQSPSPFQRPLHPRRWRHRSPLQIMGSSMMVLTNTDQSWCPSQTCLLTPNLRSALPRMSSPNCAVRGAHYSISRHYVSVLLLMFLNISPSCTGRPYCDSWQWIPVLWKHSNRRKYIVQLPDCR